MANFIRLVVTWCWVRMGMIWVTLNMLSAANRQGYVMEFHIVWRVVTLYTLSYRIVTLIHCIWKTELCLFFQTWCDSWFITCRCDCVDPCKHLSGIHHAWTMRQLRTVILWPPGSCLDGRATASHCRRTVHGLRRYLCRYSHCTRVSQFVM